MGGGYWMLRLPGDNPGVFRHVPSPLVTMLRYGGSASATTTTTAAKSYASARATTRGGKNGLQTLTDLSHIASSLRPDATSRTWSLKNRFTRLTTGLKWRRSYYYRRSRSRRHTRNAA